MQIGRVTDLPEPTEISEVGSAGLQLSLMANNAQARQLLDMVDNFGERFVPVIVPSSPSVDGLYQLTGVDASRDPNLDAAQLAQVSVSMTQVQGGRQVANSQLLVRGDNRNRVANVGLWGPLYRAGLPGDVGALSSLNVGAGGWRAASGGIERLGATRLDLGAFNLGAAISDGTHAYFGTTSSPGRVIKVDLASGARVGALTLDAGEDTILSAVTDGTHGYFGTFTGPGKVVKVDLASLTRVGSLTLDSSEDLLAAAVTDGTHGYFCVEGTFVGTVVKVDLSTMTRVGSLVMDNNEQAFISAVTDGTNGYFGTRDDPGQVVKIHLPSMTKVDTLTLDAGESLLGAATTDGTHAYFGTQKDRSFTSSLQGPRPGRVIKVNMANMTRVGALTLNSGEDTSFVGVSNGSDGYFSVNTSPGRVVKIDLATMTRLGSVTFNSGEGSAFSAVWDGTTGHFGGFEQVVRVVDRPNTTGLRGSFLEVRDNSNLVTARLVTTANRTLSGLTNASISGGTTPSDGDVVLVRAQTTASQNGLYQARSGSWNRLPGSALDQELAGTAVNVTTAAAADAGLWFIGRIYSDGQDPTTSGRAVTVVRAPGFGLRESDNGGPVSFGFDLPLASHYQAACTITDNGTTITGTRAPSQDNLRMDNGLVRVRTVGGQLVFEFAAPTDTGWANEYIVGDDFGGVGEIQALYPPSIVLNGPAECALRFRFDAGDSSGTIDVSIQRGLRTATLAITHAAPRLSRLTFEAAGSAVTMTGLSGSGAGYIAAPTRHIVYQSADNAQGHRIGASYQGALDSNLISTTPARVHVWGVHAVIGGGAAAINADGIYGMDRTFYGMLSSAQSAGIV